MNKKVGQLNRLRWAVRLVLTLGVAASVAANILHANPNPISRSISAWPPLALLLCVELVSRIPATLRWRASIRITATTLVASIAGWISYWHMAAVAGNYGETGSSSYLFPLTVDGLIVVASVSLVELNARIRSIEELHENLSVQSVQAQVQEVAVASLPVPVSPAPQRAPAPVVTSRMREHRPSQRTGPQLSGPSRPSPLTGKPLLEEPPKV